jgi:hypothetical protein
MSKAGLGKNGWFIVCTIGVLVIISATEYLLKGTGPSNAEDALFAGFLFFLWVRGRLAEQDERLRELESRIEEIEVEAED